MVTRNKERTVWKNECYKCDFQHGKHIPNITFLMGSGTCLSLPYAHLIELQKISNGEILIVWHHLEVQIIGLNLSELFVQLCDQRVVQVKERPSSFSSKWDQEVSVNKIEVNRRWVQQTAQLEEYFKIRAIRNMKGLPLIDPFRHLSSQFFPRLHNVSFTAL